MSNPTHKTPPFLGGSSVSSVIKKRCAVLGAAAQSVLLAPHIEESIRDRAAELMRECEDKVAKLREKLETAVGELVTDREIERAFKVHKQQQKEKINPQPQKEITHETNQ
jgi:hypothetical protein